MVWRPSLSTSHRQPNALIRLPWALHMDAETYRLRSVSIKQLPSQTAGQGLQTACLGTKAGVLQPENKSLVEIAILLATNFSLQGSQTCLNGLQNYPELPEVAREGGELWSRTTTMSQAATLSTVLMDSCSSEPEGSRESSVESETLRAFSDQEAEK